MNNINQKSEAAKIFADVEYVLAHAIAAPGQVWAWGEAVPDPAAVYAYTISRDALLSERDNAAPILVEVFDEHLEVSIFAGHTVLTRLARVPGIAEEYRNTIPMAA